MGWKTGPDVGSSSLFTIFFQHLESAIQVILSSRSRFNERAKRAPFLHLRKNVKSRRGNIFPKIRGIRVPKKNFQWFRLKSHLPKKPWKLRETSKFCLSVCRHLIIIEGRSINPQASRIINSLLDLFGNDQFVLEKTAKSHWCFRSWLKKWKST